MDEDDLVILLEMRSIMIMLELLLDDMMLLQKNDEMDEDDDLMIDVNVLVVDHEDSDTDVVEIDDNLLTTENDETEVTLCIELLVNDDSERIGMHDDTHDVEDVLIIETDEHEVVHNRMIMLDNDDYDDGLYGEIEVNEETLHEYLIVMIIDEVLDETEVALCMVIDEIDESQLDDIIIIVVHEWEPDIDVNEYDDQFDDDNID